MDHQRRQQVLCSVDDDNDDDDGDCDDDRAGGPGRGCLLQLCGRSSLFAAGAGG